jgi:hypothetical protein
MKKILLILIMVFAVEAQNNESGDMSVRVNPNKPSIFLEYVCQDDKNVRLKINNNSIWYIGVWTKESYFMKGNPMTLRNGAKGYAIPKNSEANIFYSVEKDELEKIKKIKIPKMESQNGGGGHILSQDSVVFPVSTKHLKVGLKIYVVFSFEWDGFGSLDKEPEHRVYFRGGDIGSENTGIKPVACQK